MLPVAVSFTGSGIGMKSILFIGWFGPRGIASVLYLLLTIISLGIEGYDRLISAVTPIVILSAAPHGITAVLFSKMLSREVKE